MMSLRKNTLSSLLVLGTAATLAIAVAACSGGDDDDDDDNTPLPNPYDSCVMWFETLTPVDDLYLIVGPVESFVSGTVNFGAGATDPFAILFSDRDNEGGRALTTNGSFSLTVPSNSLHQPVQMTDNDDNNYIVVGTGLTAATGGQGDFDGELNDWEDCLTSGSGDPEDCIIGAGTVAITLTSSGTPRAITLGADVASADALSFAMCIDVDDLFGFASPTRQDLINKFSQMHAVKRQK